MIKDLIFRICSNYLMWRIHRLAVMIVAQQKRIERETADFEAQKKELSKKVQEALRKRGE